MLFESNSPGHNEGNTMYRTKTKAVRRAAVATALGLGLVGGIAGVAAADGGTSVTNHDSTSAAAPTAPASAVEGTVVGYVSGSSISLLAFGASVPTSYLLNSATTVNGLATGTSAPSLGDKVSLVLTVTPPDTLASITIDTPLVSPPAVKVEGTVVAFVADTSISVSTNNSAVPTQYALNTFTTITGLATGVSAPAIGDHVDLTLSTSAAVVVMAIRDEGVTAVPVTTPSSPATASLRVEGTVTEFVAGASISVLRHHGTALEVYTLDGATTISGLATGVSAPAIGDHVDLTLSTSTSQVVLTIKDESSHHDENQGSDHGMGQQNASGHGRGDINAHGNSARGNSDHANWNNNGSNPSVSNFSESSLSARGSGHGSSRH